MLLVTSHNEPQLPEELLCWQHLHMAWSLQAPTNWRWDPAEIAPHACEHMQHALFSDS